MGLPGALPVANREAMELGLRFALALGCDVPDWTQFHRKHYFYPDAPKNYQISQYDRPIGEHGRLDVPGGRTIGITRVHLEEDAGRLQHPTYADHSLVDLNRAGAPLIEMVTEPEITSPQEARLFLAEVRSLARALRVSDASPEEGKMRADVNVSLRREDGSFGDKVEVKNLNSFKSVEAALRFEIERQTRQLEDGFEVAQETRGWNEGGQKTVPQRGKEDAADYRYLPDPDLPRVQIGRAWLDRIEAESPETPKRLRERLAESGVKPSDAQVLAADRDLAAVFEATLKAGDLEADQVALWCVNHVAALAADEAVGLRLAAMDGMGLARLLARLNDGTLSNSSAKSLLAEALRGEDLDALIEARGLARLADTGAIDALIAGVVEAEPALVTAALENPKAVNALVGKTMQASRGSADPGVVRERVAAYLEVQSKTA